MFVPVSLQECKDILYGKLDVITWVTKPYRLQLYVHHVSPLILKSHQFTKHIL